MQNIDASNITVDVIDVSTIKVDGRVIGNVTGNVTGDRIGNVFGNVSAFDLDVSNDAIFAQMLLLMEKLEQVLQLL